MRFKYYDKSSSSAYQINYWKGYFSPSQEGAAVQDILKQDFISNLFQFLCLGMCVDQDTAIAIARSTFERMNDQRLHYHTPVSPLSEFIFVLKYDIELELWERLAIWFKNVIYSPFVDREYNKQQSSMFMRAMLPNGLYLNDNVPVNLADRAIKKLGNHFSQEILKEEALFKVLDLDLHFLAAPWNTFEKMRSCILKEMNASMSSSRAKESFNKFLRSLLKRDFVYHTDSMRRRFENAAVTNINRALMR